MQGGRLLVQMNGTWRTNTLTIASNAVAELSVAGTSTYGYYGTNASKNVIAGGGTFVKSGTGTLELSANNYGTILKMSAGGLIDIQAGVLKNGTYQNTDWTLNRGSLNISNGASFEVWDGSTVTIDTLTGAGTVDKNQGSGGTVTINIGTNNGTGLFSGTIKNTQTFIAITKAGSGTQIFSGTNTYGGATTVNGGQLLFIGAPAISSNSTFTLNIANGLAFSNLTAATFGGLAGAGSQALTNTAGAGIALSVGANNAATTYSGNLSGAGASLTKIGAGTLILSGTNSYTGGTVVNNGVLQFNTTNAVPAPNSVTVNFGGTLAATGAFNTVAGWLGSGYLTTNSAGVIAMTVNNAESLNFSGYTNLFLGSIGTNYFTGTITPGPNGYRLGGSGRLLLTNDLALTGANALIIGGGNGGVVFLNGSNSFTGGTALNAGTLSISREANIGGAGASLTINGGTLQIRGNTITNFNTLSVFLATNVVGTFALDIANTFTLATNVTTSLNFTKAGPGTLVLSASNGLVGNVTAAAGVVNIRHNNALGVATGVVASGAALQLQGGITVANRLTLNGAGLVNDGALRNISGTNTLTGVLVVGSGARINSDADLLILSGAVTNGGNTLTVGGAGNTLISGPIGGGSGGLTKDGAGTLTLTGTNTYTGSTTLNAGTLTLDFSAAGAPLNNIVSALSSQVFGGGTLLVLSAASGVNTQTFAGHTLNPGNSTLITSTNAGGAVVVNLANFTRATGGGVLDLRGDGVVTTTANTNSSVVLQPWLTVGGTDWAALSGTRIVAFSAYTNVAGGDQIASDTNANVRVVSGGAGDITLAAAGTTSIQNLLVTNNAATTIDIGDGNILRLGGSSPSGIGGILTPAGSGGLTISNGYLTAGAGDNTAGEIIFLNRSAAPVTVTAGLTNNGTGALSVTLYGAGTFTFNGANTLSALNIRGGPTGATVVLNGATTATNGNQISNIGGASGDRNVLVINTNLTAFKIYVGVGGSAGAVIQNDGSVSASPTTGGQDVLSLGFNGGYGYYQMNGGTLTIGQLAAGGGGGVGNIGVFEQFGGQVRVNQDWTLAGGWTAGSKGEFNIYGGTFNAAGGSALQLSIFNNNGAYGFFNILGSSALVIVTNNANGVNVLGGTGNSNGVFNLNAGTLVAAQVRQSAAGNAQFNFNGGTLRAGAANVNVGMNTGGGLFVYEGGAFIDTTNSTITVTTPLLAPTGLGVSSIAVADGGAGYLGTPFVLISGGAGTGATAIAQINASGVVTGLLITSHGYGYLPGDALTVQILGGGPLQAATAGAISLATNASGGLTKLGTGTLVLASTNTYTGGTILNAGTLQLGNGGAAGSILGNSLDLPTPTSWLAYNRSDTITNQFTVTGDGGLVQKGPGTLVITNLNAYTGDTTISAGILAIDTIANQGVNSAIGAGTNLTIAASSTLSYGGATAATDRSITLSGAGNAWINVTNAATILTLTGNINFTNTSFYVYGPGTVVLTGSNYFGTAGNWGVGVQNGTLSVDLIADSGLSRIGNYTSGNVDWISIENGGVLQYTGTGTNITARPLWHNGGGMATFDITNSTGVLILNATAGTVNRSVTKMGLGTFILGGSVAWSSNLTIVAGTFQIGNSNAAGSVTGFISNNAALVFNRTDAYTYGNVISGSGSLSQNGTGTLILSTNQAYTGGTFLNAGTLQLGNGGPGGNILDTNLTLPANTFLAFNHNSAGWTNGIFISGAGGLAQNGGLNVLTNANTYTGDTWINAGALSVAVFNDTTDSYIPTNGLLTFNGGTLRYTGPGDTTSRAITNVGASTYDITSGTLTLTGNITGPGQLIKTNAGVLMLANNTANLAASSASALQVNGGTLYLSNEIVNVLNGAVQINRQGTLVLDSSYLNSANAGGGWGDQLGNFAGDSVTLIITNNSTYLKTNQTFWVGYVAGATGTVYMSSGLLAVKSDIRLGNGAGAAGYFYQSGGLVTNAGNLEIGYGAGSVGLYYLSGGVLSNAGSVRLGSGAGSVASLIITNGGQVVSTGDSVIGAGQGANSNYVIIASSTGTNSVWKLAGNLYIGNNQNSPWNTGNWLLVGQGGVLTNVTSIRVGREDYATGNYMIITNGGQVFSTGGSYIGGDQPGGNRNFAVIGSSTGTNSLWNLGGQSLYLGNGVTSISNWMQVGQGGVVTNVGGNSLRVGIGTDSVGNYLIITNGGQVFSAGTAYIGASDRNNSNSVTIASTTGTNSLWDLGAGSLYIGSGLTNIGNGLLVGQGGVLTNAGSVRPGQGNDSFGNYMIVTNGGQVFSAGNSYIGVSARASSNYVSISSSTGTDSIWNLGAGALYFGNSGTNIGNWLLVGQGGVVTNVGGNSLRVGIGADSVGNYLIITNGGQVFSAGTAYIGASDRNNSNSVTIASTTGTNSVWNLGAGGLYIGNGATNIGNGLLVGQGGVVANAGSVRSGQGTDAVGNWLVITNGGQIFSAGTSYIGVNLRASSNSVTIASATGTNSVWNLGGGALYFGNSGTNIGNWLLVDQGGVLTNAGAIVVANGVGSSGNYMIVTNGGQIFSTATSTIGNSAGANSNSVIISGTGSVWNAGNTELAVGRSGSSNLLIVATGGVLTNLSYLESGYNSGAVANGIIVTNGGQIVGFSQRLDLGEYAGSTGNYLIVTGPGSLINLTGKPLNIGGANSGSSYNWMRVDDGGVVTNGYLVVGANTTASGNQLIITNGGQVFTTLASTIGNSAGANSNTITIATGGARWNLGGTALTFGGSSTGNVLNVLAGGILTNATTVTVTGANPAFNLAGDATANAVVLGSASAQLNFNGGTLRARANGNLISGTGTAYVQSAGAFIDSAAFSVTNTVVLAEDAGSPGGGLTKLGTGTLTLTGTNTYSGPTLINAGTLTLSGINTNTIRYEIFSNAYLNVTTPGLTLAPGQELKGGGTVLGAVSANTGTISPGNSVGTLTIGALTLTNGVTLAFELGATNASDLVSVNGALTIAGMETNWFVLNTVGGFGSGTYTLFQSASLTGPLGSATNFTNIGGTSGLDGYLFLEGNNVRLEVIPEPGAGTLVVAGLALMFALRRRRR